MTVSTTTAAGYPHSRVVTALLLLAFAAHHAGAQVADYRGHQAVRVRVDSAQDLERIAAAGGELLTCEPRPGLVDVRVPPGGFDRLIRAGLQAKVLVADLGPASTRHLQRAAGTGPFDDYMPLADIEQYIRDLAAQRPDLCAVTTIGFSVQNRPISVLHITGPTGGDKPGVFYHGLQHAREWITGSVVMYIANHLVTSYDTDPCIHDLVDRTHIYLAPCVNPDGYSWSWTNDRDWRKNRRNNGSNYGVDLNRNWAYGWGGPGSSSSTGDPLYRGPSPFSEPETQTLSNFIIAHPEIRAYMDYHSYSQLILWPWGYTSSEPSEPDRSLFYTLGYALQALIQAVHGEYYEPGPIYSTIYPASGGSVDWAYGSQDVFGFTIELRPIDDFVGFELPAEQIIPTCEENLPAILHLTEFAANDLAVTTDPSGFARMTAGSPTTVSVDVDTYAGGVSPGTVKAHYRYNSAGAFNEVVMSPSGGNSYVASLPPTNCTSTPELYFSAGSTGGQTVLHPCGGPAHAFTPEMRSADAVFYSQPMDANPGWTTQGQWAWGHPTGGGGEFGGPDPTAGHTGASVYGYNLAGDYPNNLSAQSLTSLPINCSGKSGVKLSFWRWLGVEQSAYDHAAVQVSNNGATWTTIWSNTGTVADTAWIYQEFDISAVADNQPAVRLRWVMGSTDSGWRFCGWNIDDVQLFTEDCTATDGDHNGDAQVNLSDFTAFPTCVLGPEGGIGPGCAIFDFDHNNQIDLDDAAAFQRLLGP